MNIRYRTETFAIGPWTFKLKRVSNLDELIEGITDEEFSRDERLPYWAELWPSAIGLSRFLAANGTLIHRQSVLELGVGLGLTSLVLQKLEPQSLLLTDYEQPALDLVRENFILNEMPVPALRLVDWRAPNLEETFSRIVASDVLYEERFFTPLMRLFRKLLRPDGLIILAEPNRAVARSFFARLKDQGYVWQTSTSEVAQDPGPVQVTHYVIRRAR